jgi:hypothetical protein
LSFQIYPKCSIIALKFKNIMAKAFDSVPTWLMVAIFCLIVLILAVFTDVFTLVVGTLIMILIFAGGYNEKHLHDH